MKKYCLFVLSLLVSMITLAQTDFMDAVYLKNGSVIKGSIVEQVPDNHLKIQTADGNIFVYQMTEVEKIIKEEIQNKNTSLSYYDGTKIKTFANSYRNPAAAWALSFFFPGVGQIYNGQTGKGVGFMVLNLVSDIFILTDYYYDYNGAMASFGGLMVVGVWLWSWIDAIVTANSINRQYGFASIHLNNGMSIAFQPEIKSVLQNNTLTPSYGVGIHLNF